jgi:hypothetical protein
MKELESSDGHIGCQIEMKRGNFFGNYTHRSFSSNGGVVSEGKIEK